MYAFTFFKTKLMFFFLINSTILTIKVLLLILKYLFLLLNVCAFLIPLIAAYESVKIVKKLLDGMVSIIVQMAPSSALVDDGQFRTLPVNVRSS